MFVDHSVPRITQQWEGFEFLQQMLTHAVSAIQKAIDAGAFPATLSPNAAMHMLWASLDRTRGGRHSPSTCYRRRLRRARPRRPQRHYRRSAVRQSPPRSCRASVPKESRVIPFPLECVVMSRNHLPRFAVLGSIAVLMSSLVVAGCDSSVDYR